MSDIVCSACGVPKPPICYEHSYARRGDLKTICIQCVTARYRGSRRAYNASHRDEIKRKLIERLGPDGMAESLATSWEKRGLV